jgi:hypothetical protein
VNASESSVKLQICVRSLWFCPLMCEDTPDPLKYRQGALMWLLEQLQPYISARYSGAVAHGMTDFLFQATGNIHL